MISMILPLPIGNALRLFLRPPAGSDHWKVLRKESAIFSGHDDPDAAVVYVGQDLNFTDTFFLINGARAFYCPFYTVDGITWAAGAVADGTPAATYDDQSADVLSFLRDRIEAGLLVECQRGTFATELGYVQVYTAPPSLERDLRMPLVTIHLENEEPGERSLGETVAHDEFDAIGYDWDESEGWLSNVTITIIGWSLNSDERIELRKAIRRIIIGNLPVFEDKGWSLVSLAQNDIDAVNGEYPAQIYQVMNTFTCLAPVRVGGRTPAVRTINLGVNNG